MTQPDYGDLPSAADEAVGDSGKKGTAPIASDYTVMDQLSKLATGNPMLVTRPGLLQALQQNNATPAQAGAINTFMTGMDAQNQVDTARTAGTKILLSSAQMSALGAMGVDYSDVVNPSPTSTVGPGATSSTAPVTGGQAANPTKKKSGGSFLSSAGSFLSKVVGGAEGGVGDAAHYVATGGHTGNDPLDRAQAQQNQNILGVVNKAPGAVASAVGISGLNGNTISGDVSAPLNFVQAQLAENAVPGSAASVNQYTQQRDAMTALGYDPTSPLSIAAFQAKGYAHTDTSDLEAAWDKSYPNGILGIPDGHTAVIQAQLYLDDPSKFQSALIASIPAQEKADLDANKTLTPDEQADLTQRTGILSNPAFANLVSEVGGRSATVGNTVARTVGLDPVKDPVAYANVSAGTNLIASFAIDPTIVLGKAYQFAKFNSVGLSGAGDTESIRAALDPTSSNPLVKMQVRSAQSFITDMNTAREGLANGDDTAVAKAMAHANATTPGWMPLAQDLNGVSRLNEFNQVEHDVAPITDLADLTDYLANGTGMLRLTSGQAAVEEKYLPNMMTSFGYRKIKGALASATTGRANIIDLRNPKVLDQLRLMPDNIVDAVTGEDRVVQHVNTSPAGEAGDTGFEGAAADNTTAPNTATGELTNPEIGKSPTGEVNPAESADINPVLPSQARASQLTPAQQGDLRAASLKGMSPAAVATRLRLIGTRLSNELPRNNKIILGDPANGEKILKFGKTFLSKPDALLAQARFLNGGEGTQQAVLVGLRQQVGHAAGLGATDAGREVMSKWDLSDKQNFGHLGNEALVDPASGLARDAAIGLGSLQDEFYMPSFQELYRTNAKTGIWQHTLGGAYNSQYADALTSTVKLGLLSSPKTGVRNEIEGQGNIVTRGRGLDFLQARTVLQTEAQRAGDDAVAELREQGVTDKKQIRAARRQGQATVLTNRKKIFDRALGNVAARRVGQTYRAIVGKTMDPRLADYIHQAVDPDQFGDTWRPRLLGYSEGIEQDALDPNGIGRSSQMMNDGMSIAKMTRDGYDIGPTVGAAGADRWSSALRQYFGQDTDLDHALIEAVENPGGDVSGVVQALKAPHLQGVVASAQRAQQFRDASGVDKFATTDAQKDLALEQWARHMVNNASHLLHGVPADGEDAPYLSKMSQYISENGKVPFGDWIRDNFADGDRPQGAIGAQWRAVEPTSDRLKWVRTAMDSAGKGFQWMVEDPIKRTTTEPAYAMNYAGQRLWMSGIESRIRDALYKTSADAASERHVFQYSEAEKSGASAGHLAQMEADHADELGEIGEKADRAAAGIADTAASKRAYIQTESMIDDPGLKTQADVVGRNFLLFSRAVTAFGRRWGQLILEDPTRLRKLMLANEAAHHAGLSYTDANGNVNFTYPGSDLVMKGMARLSSIVPGLGTPVSYMLSSSLTGQVNMIAPGMDNPARFSLGPLVNTPAALLEKLAPGHQELWDEINSALNGEDSTGKDWFSDLVPAAYEKFRTAQNTDRGSALYSATIGAVMSLEAADPYVNVADKDLPAGAKRIVPGPDATPDEVATWLHNVQQQVKNQVYLRAAFGEFLPAAPGIPTEGVAGDDADPLFKASGVQNLSDEYKILLNDAGGDRAVATALFTQKYPGRLVYTVPTSQATTSKSYMPDTQESEDWIDGNLPFINQYKSLAAYFMPQDPGKFSLAAYEAQLETGLRQKDTPTEFLNAYMNTSANDIYYQSLDAKNAALDKALNVNDTKQATAIRSSFDDWTASFKATHPVWAQNEDNLDNKEDLARTQVTALTKMIADPNIPASVAKYAPALTAMIQSYQNQQQWLSENPAKTSIQITEAQSELAAYEAHMKAIAGTDPNLLSIYNGVFSPLNYTAPGTAVAAPTTTTGQGSK